jgi:hypothetical protein
MKEDTKREIDLYIYQGIQPGGFLEAVLSNDLAAALYAADEENATCLREILFYLNRHCPAAGRGTNSQVRAWVRGNGLAGRRKVLAS